MDESEQPSQDVVEASEIVEPVPPPKRHRGRQAGVAPGGIMGGMRVTGGTAHGWAVRKAKWSEKIEERRRKAWALFIGRATFEQIGRELGVSNWTAHQDVLAVKERRELLTALDADALCARQQGVVDDLILSHFPTRKKKDSADVILKALDREAKLQGLDKKQDSTVDISLVLNVLKDVTTLFLELVPDPDLRRRFTAGLQRKIAASLPLESSPLGGEAGSSQGV